MLQYKERYETVPAATEPLDLYYDGTPPSWSPPFAGVIGIPIVIPSYTRLYERLLSDNGGSHSDWKHCQHYKAELAYSTGEGSIGFPYSLPSATAIGRYSSAEKGANPIAGYNSGLLRSSFGILGAHTVGLPTLTEESPDGSFISHPADINVAIDRAVRAMMPGIKSELSLVNSIIELKDFISLPRMLARLKDFVFRLPNVGRRLTNAYGKVRGTFSRSQGPTMREAFRLGADSYLQTQFNILPLLSDISAIQRALSKTEKRLNDLLVRQGKRQVRHYSLSWWPSYLGGAEVSTRYGLEGDGVYYPTDGSLTGAYYYGHMLGMEMTRSTLIRRSAKFHAQIEFNFHFTQFQQEHARVLALLDAFGVNLNPAIIWNAIPYTFLVDWVINVSKWLSDRTHMNMEPVINITKFLYSTRVERTVKLAFQSYQVGAPPVHRTELPELNETAYRRDVGFPPESSLLASGLSLKEFSLGLALLTTRGRNPKPRTGQVRKRD